MAEVPEDMAEVPEDTSQSEFFAKVNTLPFIRTNLDTICRAYATIKEANIPPSKINVNAEILLNDIGIKVIPAHLEINVPVLDRYLSDLEDKNYKFEPIIQEGPYEIEDLTANEYEIDDLNVEYAEKLTDLANSESSIIIVTDAVGCPSQEMMMKLEKALTSVANRLTSDVAHAIPTE